MRKPLSSDQKWFLRPNFKKDPPWYIFFLSVHAPATSEPDFHLCSLVFASAASEKNKRQVLPITSSSCCRPFSVLLVLTRELFKCAHHFPSCLSKLILRVSSCIHKVVLENHLWKGRAQTLMIFADRRTWTSCSSGTTTSSGSPSRGWPTSRRTRRPARFKGKKWLRQRRLAQKYFHFL